MNADNRGGRRAMQLIARDELSGDRSVERLVVAGCLPPACTIVAVATTNDVGIPAFGARFAGQHAPSCEVLSKFRPSDGAGARSRRRVFLLFGELLAPYVPIPHKIFAHPDGAGAIQGDTPYAARHRVKERCAMPMRGVRLPGASFCCA